MSKKKKPPAGEPPVTRMQVSRRDFLRYTSVATAALATPSVLLACGPAGEALQRVARAPRDAPDVRRWT